MSQAQAGYVHSHTDSLYSHGYQCGRTVSRDPREKSMQKVQRVNEDL